MNILVAEDEKRLADAVRFLLQREGHRVTVVHDGQSAFDYIDSDRSYDLLILDVMMPKINGFDLLSRIRKDSCATPVLMLTALSQTSDKVEGLDKGADDYLTKPFQPAELLARVRALTRRTGKMVLDEISYQDLTLDLNTHLLQCMAEDNGNKVRLSEKEFEVLSLLMRHGNQVLSKEQLITGVWGFDSYVEDNNLEAYISFIRKKLKHIHSQVIIETIRGVGYSLKHPSDSEL